MKVPQILHIDRAVDIQVVHGKWWFLFSEGPVCVPEACDVRVTVAVILKEKLTLKSPDEIDTAVRNPKNGSTRVRTNSENASEVKSKLESVGTPARVRIVTRGLVRSRVSSASCFATCPLRRRGQRLLSNTCQMAVKKSKQPGIGKS